MTKTLENMTIKELEREYQATMQEREYIAQNPAKIEIYLDRLLAEISKRGYYIKKHYTLKLNI